MINPTPVHNSKNSPYSSVGNRRSLPKAMAVQPTKPTKKRFSWKRLLVFSFVLLLFASGTLIYAQYTDLRDAIIINHEGQSSSILSYDPNGSKDLDPSQFTKIGDGRFNVLIVGVGGANHPGGNLTDSIQIMSVDTINKKIGITSVPRDLYVKIPDYGYSKINATYSVGEQQKKGNGAYLMRQVVGDVLGVPISNFVLIDFSGAKQVVDDLGGIDVDVPTAIYDPYFPDDNTVGYSPFSIKAGLQHMNGTTALRYSRSRETTSDFDRSARQQLVIQAIKKKALSAGTLSSPTKISNVLTSLGQHLKTDMTTSEIAKFIAIYQDIPSDNTTTNVLDTSEKLGLLTSSSGTSAGYISYPVLGKGNYDDIHQWFNSNNPDPLIAKDGAHITVVGSSKATAKQTQAFVSELKDYGFNVTYSSNSASDSYSKTTLYTKKSGSKKITENYLSNFLSVSPQSGSPLDSGSDFEIVYVPTSSSN